MSLVPIEDGQSHIVPRDVVTRGHQVADACRQIVMQCSIDLKGKRYIKAEGWQALAAANGLSPRINCVEELTGGDIRAVCDLIRLSDGEIVASAEGFVGTDEPMWSSRPRYAKRAMAQTRATSRACRSALAWVVPLLDASLQTTPAEEMDHAELAHVEIVPKPRAAAKQAQVVAVEPKVAEPRAVMASREQLDQILKLHAEARSLRPTTIKPTELYFEDLRGDYEIKTKKVSQGLQSDHAVEVIEHLQGVIRLGAE